MRTALPVALALTLLLTACRETGSFRPGQPGRSWTYSDSTVTTTRTSTRERVERLGEPVTLTTADGRTLECRTLEVISNGQPLSRIYFEDLGDELRIHRLDHLPANEVIRYDPGYPMLAPIGRDTTLACTLMLSRGEESTPYQTIQVELAVHTEKLKREVGGKTQTVHVQELREKGAFGMVYRNTWARGLGLLEQEIRGTSPQFSTETHIRLRDALPE